MALGKQRGEQQESGFSTPVSRPETWITGVAGVRHFCLLVVVEAWRGGGKEESKTSPRFLAANT